MLWKDPCITQFKKASDTASFMSLKLIASELYKI